MSSGSFKTGRKEGGKFVDQARKHPIAHRIDPFFNPKPHRTGDREYNEGVKRGIKDKGGDRW